MSVVEERALPSVIDGFKPAARKVVHAAITGSLKDGKLYKLLALSGDSMKLSLYSHGDMSLNSVIVNLCKEFSDNLNPLESDSQVGTLRDPDSAGSPRYLYVKHSRWMDTVYKTDYGLLNFVFEEGQYVEPEHYLPIIPAVLCRNNIGVAVGYAMHNISYSPVDVTNACIEYLKSGKISKTIICPYIKGIDNETMWRRDTDKDGNAVWVCEGKFDCNKARDKMTVVSLPYDVTFDSFEKLLTKFEESGFIKSWTNLSEGESINYEITFNKGQLKKLVQTPDATRKLAQKFKLIKTAPSDLLWMLDKDKKLVYFNDIYDIVKYFCSYRLSIYKERKKRTVKALEDKYSANSDMCRFIKRIIDGTLKISNRPKTAVKADMDKLSLPVSLLSTPMAKLTKEEVSALENENADIKRELDYIKATTEKDMYLDDLNKLKRTISKLF